MNKQEKELIDRLESMPFIEARKGIKNGTLYTIDSPNHKLALSWLEGKEAELRDERETETLSIAEDANLIARSMRRSVRKDRIIAIVAVIIAAIAAREEIMWFISFMSCLIKQILKMP
jgi:hypothetical protein